MLATRCLDFVSPMQNAERAARTALGHRSAARSSACSPHSHRFFPLTATDPAPVHRKVAGIGLEVACNGEAAARAHRPLPTKVFLAIGLPLLTPGAWSLGAVSSVIAQVIVPRSCFARARRQPERCSFRAHECLLSWRHANTRFGIAASWVPSAKVVKKKPNPSVKPTASGLRPPAAAYLKCWSTQIPA